MIDEVVGQTPVVRLQRVGGGAVHLKLETRSPNATVMDRVARHLSGWTTAGDGALGVALAMRGAVRGQPVEVTLPEDVPLEVRQTLMTYGAKVTLQKFPARPTADVAAALTAAFEEIAAELLASEERVDAFIGPPQFARWFKKVVGVRSAAQPNRQHGADALGGDGEVVDDATAWRMRERLGREEGLLLSAATAAHVEAACRVAARLGPDARVYALAFDTGERSFSTAEQL